MPKSSWEVVISIDPATTSGYAILYYSGGALDRDYLLEYGVLKDSERTGRDMLDVMTRALNYVESIGTIGIHGPRVEHYIMYRGCVSAGKAVTSEGGRGKLRVVIEDQFLRVPHGTGIRQKANPDTLKKVARFSGGWKAVAQCVGCDTSVIDFVQPHEWQSSLLNIGSKSGPRRTELKNASQNLARVLYGMDATQDEADAICLAHYYARARRIDGLNNSEVQDELHGCSCDAAVESWGSVRCKYPSCPIRPARKGRRGKQGE